VEVPQDAQENILDIEVLDDATLLLLLQRELDLWKEKQRGAAVQDHRIVSGRLDTFLFIPCEKNSQNFF
jgi:hypothetical protein